ncbi:hypothetical protein [Spiroplasma monobiae]|uniref:Uncharacterized protein n=1 Tax=Spiroplasma monobiae MQ-1 TaxID=1336748 RepID=A0A2K9LUE0_SPISQ|nr:hypothetical protein [Spiroplasma monobiae]AUM62666.1 hypothetical protein SMONO_v1c04170 [Spiroplasma monobiae MQ-1]
MKKSLLSLNENLEHQVDYIYYNQSLDMCVHKTIAMDSRDNKFKCIDCFVIFAIKTKKQVLSFNKRLIKEFNFEKAEITLKKKIKKQRLEEDDEE